VAFPILLDYKQYRTYLFDKINFANNKKMTLAKTNAIFKKTKNQLN